MPEIGGDVSIDVAGVVARRGVVFHNSGFRPALCHVTIAQFRRTAGPRAVVKSSLTPVCSLVGSVVQILPNGISGDQRIGSCLSHEDRTKTRPHTNNEDAQSN